MKKIMGALIAAAFTSAGLFAYNPPAGGQNVLRLTQPQLLTGANSTAGGGLLGVTPSSVVNNPALTAGEQRVTLDLAGSLFINTNTDNEYNQTMGDNTMGGAFQGGLLIPSRWCVSTLLVQGLWTDFIDMPVGNSFNFTGALAKDITDQVYVGMSANFGLLYGDAVDSDWAASVAFGAYYNFGDLAFMRNFRFGVNMNNIGKMYAGGSSTLGIESYKYLKDNDRSSMSDGSAWPGIATIRTGAAATFVKTDILDLGLSLDFAFPGFQNFVTDIGLQIQLWDFLKIASSWEFDAQEFANDSKNLMPSVGVSFKFRFKSKEGSFLARKGWAESDMTVSTAWKQLYSNVNAVSAGAVMNLGLADTKAPEIIMWEDE
ncbi:MAG: hypothetical protein K5873_05065 [Treponema sp.]|nr:hypothetical protein [Treponema sp.]